MEYDPEFDFRRNIGTLQRLITDNSSNKTEINRLAILCRNHLREQFGNDMTEPEMLGFILGSNENDNILMLMGHTENKAANRANDKEKDSPLSTNSLLLM